MTERNANGWILAISWVGLATAVAFVIFSSLHMQEKLADLKGDIAKKDKTIADMRAQFDWLVNRLDAQHVEQIEYLCMIGKGRFEANRVRCTFDDGRPSLTFISLTR